MQKGFYYEKKLLTRTALAATIALGIGSFNLAYAAETEDTSSGKKINVAASFYPMYDFATKGWRGIRLSYQYGTCLLI